MRVIKVKIPALCPVPKRVLLHSIRAYREFLLALSVVNSRKIRLLKKLEERIEAK